MSTPKINPTQHASMLNTLDIITQHQSSATKTHEHYSLKCLNPHHTDSSSIGSFFINHNQDFMFNCFSCNLKGNYYTLIKYVSKYLASNGITASTSSLTASTIHKAIKPSLSSDLDYLKLKL